MKVNHLSIKNLYVIVGCGTVLSMMAVALVLYRFTGSRGVLLCGILLPMCALGWFFLLAVLLSRRLSAFTADICETLDGMISGSTEYDAGQMDDAETLFARILHRLSRLYDIMKENRQQAYKERKE